MTTLKQILEENAKKHSRGQDSMDLPLYPIQWDIIQRGIKEWLQQKQQAKSKENNPDNIDDEYRWAQSDLLDELLEELKDD